MRRLFDPRNYKFSTEWINEWNSHVDEIMKNDSVNPSEKDFLNESTQSRTKSIKFSSLQVIESFQLLHDFNETLDVTKQIIYQLANGLHSSMLNANHIKKLCSDYCDDGFVKRITDLSVLEICLLIAIKHHSEIYDHDPFNFEIIFTRMNKFIRSSHMNPYDKSVALGSFEKLQVSFLF